MSLRRRTISALLLCIIFLFPSTVTADVSDDLVSHKLESDFEDGTFVNGTLNITGTITSDPTDVYWGIYDYDDLAENLLSPEHSLQMLTDGNFFTEVIPLSVDRWQWRLEVDVSALDCACILTVHHLIDNQKTSLYLHKTIFIGEGPFSPILLITDTEMIDTTNFELKLSGAVANGVLNESTIIISFCKLTSGFACDESTNHTRELPATWSGNGGILVLNFGDLELSEGKWSFALSLRDSNLLQSSFPLVVSRKVDLNPPSAVLVTSESVNQSSTIILDGSASSDGIWTSDLQAVWYITEPNGTIRNPNELENQGLSLILQPVVPGNWTVRLDVIDIRGRISSNETTFEVLNVAPEAFISLDELDLNDHRYRMPHWADWALDSADSYDLADDNTLLVHRWYVDGELVSNVSRLDISELNLQPGDHEVILEVIDAGGASGTSSMVLEVYADESDSNSTPVLGWLTIALVMIVLIIFTVKYIQSREEISPSVPRWQDNRQLEVDDDESSVEAMWDEPA